MALTLRSVPGIEDAVPRKTTSAFSNGVAPVSSLLPPSPLPLPFKEAMILCKPGTCAFKRFASVKDETTSTVLMGITFKRSTLLFCFLSVTLSPKGLVRQGKVPTEHQHAIID